MTFNAFPLNSAPLNSPGGGPTQTGEADGFLLATFGTPSYAAICLAESLEILTVIPQVYVALDQYAQAESWEVMRFGTPLHRPNPDVSSNLYGSAAGFLLTAFGTPQSPYTQTCEAGELLLGVIGDPTSTILKALMSFGQHRATVRQDAMGFVLTSMGQPVLALTASTLGVIPQFGQPSAATSRTAVSTLLTKYGQATAFLGGHKVSPLRLGGRFGQPRVRQGAVVVAEGFVLPAYGTGLGFVRNRALPTPPIMQFGLPKLQRNPEC